MFEFLVFAFSYIAKWISMLFNLEFHGSITYGHIFIFLFIFVIVFEFFFRRGEKK